MTINAGCDIKGDENLATCVMLINLSWNWQTIQRTSVYHLLNSHESVVISERVIEW